jgi:hypothetical protein
MMKAIRTMALLMLFALPLTAADEILTNEQVVMLIKAGLSPETVAEKIRISEVDFDTSTAALIELAKQGVPDRLVRLMIEEQADRGPAGPEAATPPTPPVVTAPSAVPPPIVMAPPVIAPAPPPAVTPVPKTPAPAAKAKEKEKVYTYEVTYRKRDGGPCAADLRVSGSGLRILGCSREEDFTIPWSSFAGACYLYGARGIVVFSTADAQYQVETIRPIDASDIVSKTKRVSGIVAKKCDAIN